MIIQTYSRQYIRSSLLFLLMFTLLACSTAPANSDAPDKQQSAIHTSANTSPTLTSDEKAEQFDQSLDDGFAEFDRLLLRERERLNKEQNEQGGNGNGLGNADGEGFGEFEGDGEAQTDPALSGKDISQQHEGQDSGVPSRNTRANIPPDLKNSKNDDVIARQLREAALKEKDPVLQKKLWDEYRKYTQGTKSR